MITNNILKISTNYADFIDSATVSAIVDAWYDNMLGDYRVCRFFYPRDVSDQTRPLKVFLNALMHKDDYSPEALMLLLNDYFMASFARGNTQHSAVSGQDFAFLLDIVGGKEIRTITLICDAHSHLLKLGPDDENYDVAMEHLANTLKQLNIPADQSAKIMTIAENARDMVLGRGAEFLQAA